MANNFVGVCLGASSVSLVKINVDSNKRINIIDSVSTAHNGFPKSQFEQLLSVYNQENFPVIVTGRKFRNLVNIPSISEPEATEIAFSYIDKNSEKYSAIASLGGETFIVYMLDDESKISNVITRNQCASGTGEFFLQQIKRMNLNIDETIDLARNVEPHKVSGRCSVFCKSDCTHALNKGIPKSEVASGLSLMIAEKIEELIPKNSQNKIMLVGGVTNNDLVIDFLRSKNYNISIPIEANYFEALGAAIYGFDKNINYGFDIKLCFLDKKSSFSFHKPLNEFTSKVSFKSLERRKAIKGEKCILGLDVGSTTTKAVLIGFEDNQLLADVYLYTNGNPIKASQDCYQELLNQVPVFIHIIGLGTTGSGRQIAGIHAMTEGVVNEIVAHATAAVHFDPEVDTLFEIGGQDAKYTYIVNKVPADYAMNEACSAGTGSFIEESAWESLGISVKDIEPIAMKSLNPPNFSDQCAAFISSDIKTALQENLTKEDVVAGLVYSICLNYLNRVKGNRPVGKKIFMQGGVCYNKAIPIAMAALSGVDIIVPPEPGLMGAFGVALVVQEKLQLGIIEEMDFSLEQLINREVIYKKPFTCLGGSENCDRKCVVSIIEVEGKKFPFGGSCNKYYNLKNIESFKQERYDYVKRRQYLTFREYAPISEIKKDALRIGISTSFHAQTIYPLFYNFFTQLGFEVVIPDAADEEGMERESTSFCYPAQISLGLFHNLMMKKPDYYFMPSILEMYVEDAEHHRMDFNCTCVFVSGETYYLKQAFKDLKIKEKIISPNLNFAMGWDKEEKSFFKIAQNLGIKDKRKIIAAYRFAVDMQNQYQEGLYKLGNEILDELADNPDDFAIVLVGRPYNAFAEIANKGIPKKFANRGIYVIPYDMFDYRKELVDDNQYWEGGKKILKVAKIVKDNPQLFATYISNFSCGPDSMIMTTFRNIMGTKPSLTLELDGHTADAGINTRIDAAIDIIKNYRKMAHLIKDKDFSDFKHASIEVINDTAYFHCSSGEYVPLNSKNVDILIPSMGDLSAKAFASALKSLGFNAIALPEGNQEILKYGRSHSSGKECLPLILLVGSLLDYIKNRWNGKNKIAFFTVQGAGNCRLGQYPVFIRDVIKSERLTDVTQMILMNEDGFAGFGSDFALRGIQSLIASDVIDDIRSAILAHSMDPDESIKIFDAEYDSFLMKIQNSFDKFYEYLDVFALNINKKIPERIPISEAKYLALLGEIYVRRDGFSHKWLNKSFAKKGFILKTAHISEWIMYVDHLLKINLLEPDKSIGKKFEQQIRHFFMVKAEKRIKRILEKSGYYKYSMTNVKEILNHSKHLIPLDFKGEPGLVIGTTVHESLEKYAGIINLGPFGCMPTRITEAIINNDLNVESKIEAKKLVNSKYELSKAFNGKMSIPFLTMEVDGNVFPQVIEARLETFILQAERASKLMKDSENKF